MTTNGAPNPLNQKNLSRAAVAGLVLSILGIGLFIGLWIGLGNAGMDQFPRLILSMCVPPALMAGILGAYILLARPKSKE
jgi:hypothetical protein